MYPLTLTVVDGRNSNLRYGLRLEYDSRQCFYVLFGSWLLLLFVVCSLEEMGKMKSSS
jgi:hypothetical protein